MGNSTTDNKNHYVHARLGEVKRVSQNGEYFLLFSKMVSSSKFYEDWQSVLQSLIGDSELKSILYLPVHYTFDLSSFCSGGGRVNLKMEDYLYSLAPEIVNRKFIKRPFSESELLYLLYNLVKLATLLKEKGFSIGTINPENVVVSDQGYIKIITIFSWPEYHSLPQNRRLFLSPEECDCEERKREKQSSPTDPYSVSFSIALTILEAGTLADVTEIYGTTSEYHYSKTKTEQFIGIFSSKYSMQLSSIVKEMLLSNPRQRLTFNQAYECLRDEEIPINNLQPAVIELGLLKGRRNEKEDKLSIRRISSYGRGDRQGKNQKNKRINFKMLNKSISVGNGITNLSNRVSQWQRPETNSILRMSNRKSISTSHYLGNSELIGSSELIIEPNQVNRKSMPSSTLTQSWQFPSFRRTQQTIPIYSLQL